MRREARAQDEKPHRCGECGSAWRYPENLARHRIRAHSPIRCITCGRRFKDREMLDSHTKRSHPPRTCRRCGQDFRTERAFEIHVLLERAENENRRAGPEERDNYMEDLARLVDEINWRWQRKYRPPAPEPECVHVAPDNRKPRG